MSFNEAVKASYFYLFFAIISMFIGIPLLFVSVLRIFYNISANQNDPFSRIIQNFVYDVYTNFQSIQWIWQWTSEKGMSTTLSPLLYPSAMISYTFVIVGCLFLRSWYRLHGWVNEAKLNHKKSFISNSFTANSAKQHVGTVISGRDSNIHQNVTNNYNNKPESPKYPILVAAIGFLGAIISAYLHK